MIKWYEIPLNLITARYGWGIFLRKCEKIIGDEMTIDLAEPRRLEIDGDLVRDKLFKRLTFKAGPMIQYICGDDKLSFRYRQKYMEKMQEVEVNPQ